jgi:gas vesicle protein
MNNTKLVISILGAAAAGLVIGMLIAPDKGTELRANIKRTADDWVDEVSQWIGRGKEYLEEARTRASQEVNDLTSQAEEGVNTMKDDLARRRS